MDMKLEYEGITFYVDRKPATVFFFEDGIVVDHVTFNDVQAACEYLVFCNYRKDEREDGLWYKGKGQEAFVMYTEVERG